MTNISITEITVGTGRLAVANHGNRADNSSTLIITYAEAERYRQEVDYKTEAVWKGIPLSTSIFYNPVYDPSLELTRTSSTYYTLDIIKYPTPNPSEGTINDISFVLNGNRLSAIKVENKYYMNVVESSNLELPPSKEFMFLGLPMMTNSLNELFVRDSGLGISDIDEFVEIMIGGIPVRAARVDNKNYLLVQIIDETSA